MSDAARIGLVGLVLALACFEAACDSRRLPAPQTSVTTHSKTTFNANGELKVLETSWTIEVGADVLAASVPGSGSGGPSGLHMTLNGMQFEFRDGRLFRGEVDLGAAPPGATLIVNSDGVVVEGERRRATPELVHVGGE